MRETLGKRLTLRKRFAAVQHQLRVRTWRRRRLGGGGLVAYLGLEIVLDAYVSYGALLGLDPVEMTFLAD